MANIKRFPEPDNIVCISLSLAVRRRRRRSVFVARSLVPSLNCAALVCINQCANSCTTNTTSSAQISARRPLVRARRLCAERARAVFRPISTNDLCRNANCLSFARFLLYNNNIKASELSERMVHLLLPRFRLCCYPAAL